jgi:ERF superfamily
MSDKPPTLAAALAELQQHLPRIPRTATGQAGNRTYKYPPYDKILTRVRPVLAAHGWVWSTCPNLSSSFGESARFVLAYRLTHIATGEFISGSYPLTEGPPQQQGSQISYAKRYCLVAVLDLEVVGEDDDEMPERTPAKIPGPDHERLRHGTVEPTPDDRPAERARTVDSPGDNPWTDAPPGNFDIGTPEDHPGSIDSRQIKQLQIAFRQAGITDRAVRLGMTADLIGREVLTANQLSHIEADAIIKYLKEFIGNPSD